MEKPPDAATCHADRDGDCSWRECPQLRDGEPKKTGRHCPLDVRVEMERQFQERLGEIDADEVARRRAS